MAVQSPIPSRRPCDIVMKGGVTSGVVYPAAICEIAKAFDLRNIGGTSAGAIAAALAAAAQYRRARGGPQAESGYEQLATIPKWLATDDNLFNLFAPDKGTRSLFAIVVALLMPQSLFSRIGRVVQAYWLAAAIGAIPGIMYLWAATYDSPGAVIEIHTVFATLVLIGGAALGALVKLLDAILRLVPANGYGLVKGAVTEEPAQAGRPAHAAALCSWLACEMERIAGLDVGNVPLTFGMLWNPACDPSAVYEDDVPEERTIQLEMITTCITQGMPYRFPCSTAGLYFRKDDLKGYFPDHIVQWLLNNPRPGATEKAGYSVLPAISDLPVIVATRLSLSFPFLLSAIKLYAIDHTLADEQQVPAPCWFSDGGICSNFPIAFFDSPLPRWPTLAISLGGFSARTSQDGVYMPATNDQGRLRPFSPVTSLFSFFGSIISTMQNWSDDEQSKLPSFRDRIAMVALHADEGGLNLQMSSEILAGLENRGARAGEELRTRFEAPSNLQGPDHAMNWENHRWLRFRTTMDADSHYLHQWNRGWSEPVEGDVSFEDLAKATSGLPAHSYPIIGKNRELYMKNLGSIEVSATSVTVDPVLEAGAPKPVPELVLRPKQ